MCAMQRLTLSMLNQLRDESSVLQELSRTVGRLKFSDVEELAPGLFIVFFRTDFGLHSVSVAHDGPVLDRRAELHPSFVGGLTTSLTHWGAVFCFPTEGDRAPACVW